MAATGTNATARLGTRSAGLLLHPTSLPGPYFTGDLGPEARTFIDSLAEAGCVWWQMLPVNPTGEGDSPYATTSSFAGEPLLLSLDELRQRGWLKRGELGKPAAGAGSKANYQASRRYRKERLELAFRRASAGLAADEAFQRFRRDAAWLADFSLFTALSERYGCADWTTWPQDVKAREPRSLTAARELNAEAILYTEFCQYLFATQWTQLKAYGVSKGVHLIGDLPIFVAAPSADVWANQELFLLGPDGKPSFIAGCPPDAFNRDGQLWGNALYDWKALEATGFAWWLERLRRATELFAAVRLDHFIGYCRYWASKAGAKTARQGHWQPAPAEAFFAAVDKQLPGAQLIAEDLGAVTPEIRAVRDRYGFPGMKVLQFAFDGSAEAHQHLPHVLTSNSVVYTGTHDNDTTRGWAQSLREQSKGSAAARRELARVEAYLGDTQPLSMIRAALASPAATAIVPVQDLLGLGSASRMNTPGTSRGNWRYRMRERLPKEQVKLLAQLLEVFDRKV